MNEIHIDTPFITLGQLLKMADLVGSGGEVKHFLSTEHVLVNGLDENRRGRKLVPGDKVVIHGSTYLVTAN